MGVNWGSIGGLNWGIFGGQFGVELDLSFRKRYGLISWADSKIIVFTVLNKLIFRAIYTLGVNTRIYAEICVNTRIYAEIRAKSLYA